uniref:Uncharacterized protein n=1 Tax=Arundo donax TaxID=35708 RepID=A0A0A9C4A5_ARUDO
MLHHLRRHLNKSSFVQTYIKFSPFTIYVLIQF